jgi:hypothetical protein
MNENPWRRLPEESPFVLPEDRDKVLAFNKKASQNRFLRLDLIPEPFVGRPGAPLVILANNPGAKNSERAEYRRNPEFVKRMRDNLLHELSADFPFCFLDPDPNLIPPGKAWWELKLKWLFDEFENRDRARAILARSILAVDFFPYISRKYKHDRLSLPSQDYSFDLVRKAVNRGAVIVLTRGQRRWLKAIPELDRHPGLVRLKEVQRAPISPDNCCDDGYQKVVRAIESVLP